MTTILKPGVIVTIAPNQNHQDCCQGCQGRIDQPARGGGWLIKTEKHLCSIPRMESQLNIVPPQELARQYFELEGWDVYRHYMNVLATNGLTIQEISTAADHGNSNCRHFLALYLAEVAA